jgi:hypothetical protein
MSNNTAPNSLRIINENIATEKYQLKKQLSAIFEGWNNENNLKNYCFLVTDGDLTINGDLRLDYDGDTWATDSLAWRKLLNIADDENLKNNYGIRGVIISGNLTVNGSIINSNMSDGPFLLVMGNVSAHNLVAGGAYFQINGNANIRGVVYGHYNDGSICIDGDLSAEVLINDDHSFSYGALKNMQFWCDSMRSDSTESLYDSDGLYAIPKKLRALLGDDILAWEDILASLCNGDEVLKSTAAKSSVKDAAYWHKLVLQDGDNLSKVPKAEITAALCEAAINKSGLAIQYVPTKLITLAMCENIVMQQGTLLDYIPQQFITKALCYLAAKNTTNIRDIPEQFLDYDLTYEVIRFNAWQIEFIPVQFMDNKMIINYMSAGGELEMFNKICSHFKIKKEDVAMQAAQTTFEQFICMPNVAVNQAVYDVAKSKYANHPAWSESIKYGKNVNL